MGEIGIGMLGYAFMGKAHSNAFKKIAYITWPPPLEPRLVGIAGRNVEAVGEAAQRYGYEYATGDWRELIADDRIGLFDNGGPNSLHGEPTIAAAQAGKHVICEKPLGRDADESYEIWRAVAATGVRHMCVRPRRDRRSLDDGLSLVADPSGLRALNAAKRRRLRPALGGLESHAERDIGHVIAVSIDPKFINRVGREGDVSGRPGRVHAGRRVHVHNQDRLAGIPRLRESIQVG